METRIKNYVGWALVFALVVVALSAVAFVHAFGKISPPSQRTFTVSAEGKAVAIPDIAQFTFSVITEGANLANVQKDNADRTKKIADFLGGQDIDEKDVTTIGYQVSPRYQYFPCTGVGPCRQPQIDGYTVTQTTRVKVRDFDKTGDLISGVVAQGANSVSELSFTNDDPEAARNAARADAVAKAKHQAEMVAKAGGFRVGKLISVSESGVAPPMPYAGYGGFEAKAMDSAAQSAPVIQPGSQDITVVLMATYEIR